MFDLWDSLSQRGHSAEDTARLLRASRPVPAATPPVEAGSVITHVANKKTKLQRGK